MKISVLTMFPQFFESFMEMSLTKRSIEKGKAEIEIVDIREFAGGSFRHIDDSPYGGGKGMIIRYAPVLKALESVRKENSLSFLMSPKGEVLTQKKARELSSKEHIILVCGHYEGIDARIEKHIDEQLSIGDYVLSGGESAALIVMDSIIRLLDGVLREGSAETETHENGLLEYPQYTRPSDYNGDRVPAVLLSGNQKKIDEWRLTQSLMLTKKYRPDMFEKYSLSKEEKKLLEKAGAFQKNYTYILECSDGSLYTGWTNDMDERLKAHNDGRGAKYTKSRRPVKLVYLEESETKSEAMSREAKIKKLSRKEKLELIKNKE